MQEESPASIDLGLGLVLIVVASGIIFGTWDLPEGSFEPLGSASIPRYVAGGVIVLSIWIMAQAIARMRQPQEPSVATLDAQDSFALRPGLAAALVAFTVVYVGVMAMEWLRFSIATAIFTLAAVGMLTKFERRLLPGIGVLALVLGVGLEYVFTQVFVIDLP